MQNRHNISGNFRDAGNIALRQAKHIGADLWGIRSIMAAIQSHDQLAKYAPNKAFLCPVSLELEVLDHSPEITIATVLHIQMQVLARLQMLTVVVGNDVGVSQVGEDLELGVQLFTLLLGHAEVRDLLAAHDEAIGSAANFANDTKGAMTYDDGRDWLLARVNRRAGTAAWVVIVMRI